MALQEAQRAHVVLFVCDGDLTRAESQAVGYLLALDKPLVLVMNKADRFTVEEQAAIMQKLMQRVDDMGGSLERDRVVAVSAGGEMDIVQRATDTLSVRRNLSYASFEQQDLYREWRSAR